MVKKIKITIDGKEFLVEEGMTVLKAAQEQHIHIPTLCHHPALSSWGGCRMCLVEIDHSPKLAASCVTPVREGMEVVTSNENILESRRTILEFIFSERNHNCMFCPKSGDCELQTLAYELQMDHLTVSNSFDKFQTDITSEYMGIDHNRCILCGRCVRACNEISGAHVLNFINRGPESLIGLDLNITREESVCSRCGVCIQVCPTGAIFNRYRSHYAVKGHNTDWEKVESLCPQCGLLCPAVFYTQNNNLIKVEGMIDAARNDRPDRGQLCYKLRFDALKNSGERLVSPMVKNTEGEWVEKGWDDALGVAAKKLQTICEKEGKESIFGFISSSASNEEMVLFRDFMHGCFGPDSADTLDGGHYRNVKRAWQDQNVPHKEAKWEMIPDADFILIIGADPHRTQPPILPLLLKSVFTKKVHVSWIGEDESLKPYATHHISVKKTEQYSAILEFLNKAISSSTDQPSLNPLKYFMGGKQGRVPRILKDLDKGGALTKSLNDLALAFNMSTNPLIIVGDKITSLHPPDALKGAMKMALFKGLLPEDTMRLMILKPNGNSASAWKMGLPSENEPLLRTEIKGGIVLFSEESDLPDFRWRFFKEAEFLAVISPYVPKNLPENVRVIIPKPIWLEEDGTYASLDGLEVSYKNRVLIPPEGVKDTWLTLVKLMERMGLKPEFKMPGADSKKYEKEIRDKKNPKKKRESRG